MRGLRAALIGIPPVVLLVVLILLAMPFCATCGGHSEAVTDLVKRCKRATELLGDDAHPARMGVACGQTETSGGNGHASWNLPYTGSRDRGTVSFDAIKRGGMWTIDRAALEVGSETIDLIACVGTPQPPPVAVTLSQTNADDAQANFAGKIIRSTHPTLGVFREPRARAWQPNCARHRHVRWGAGLRCTGLLQARRAEPSSPRR
jgi:Cytochrome oxidase complex assembly protein 1